MAAFKGTIDTSYDKEGTVPGPSYRFSASDAAAAFVTFDDLPGTPAVLAVPTGRPLYLSDLTVSAVGGTVVAFQISKGTALLDKIIRIGRLLETLAGMDARSRIGALKGIRLEGGALYGLKQL